MVTAYSTGISCLLGYRITCYHKVGVIGTGELLEASINQPSIVKIRHDILGLD